jgi:hypothetical protein
MSDIHAPLSSVRFTSSLLRPSGRRLLMSE